jgi:hypothetical protein
MQAGSKFDKKFVCGYYFRAVVIEALKGGRTPFSFFSAVDSDFNGFDKEYLVFAFSRDPEDVRDAVNKVADLMPSGIRGDLMCRAFGELYVPVQPQLLRSFDSEAARLFGGLWLALPNRDSIIWCKESLLAASDESDVVLQSRQKIPGTLESTVISWQGIRAAIVAETSWWSLLARPRCGTVGIFV